MRDNKKQQHLDWSVYLGSKVLVVFLSVKCFLCTKHTERLFVSLPQNNPTNRRTGGASVTKSHIKRFFLCCFLISLTVGSAGLGSALLPSKHNDSTRCPSAGVSFCLWSPVAPSASASTSASIQHSSLWRGKLLAPECICTGQSSCFRKASLRWRSWKVPAFRTGRGEAHADTRRLAFRAEHV